MYLLEHHPDAPISVPHHLPSWDDALAWTVMVCHATVDFVEACFNDHPFLTSSVLFLLGTWPQLIGLPKVAGRQAYRRIRRIIVLADRGVREGAAATGHGREGLATFMSRNASYGSTDMRDFETLDRIERPQLDWRRMRMVDVVRAVLWTVGMIHLWKGIIDYSGGLLGHHF
ncbi:hypothetical protein BOTBODRAFT_39230 [Botryobasidium botryosum FD-172 SS1]|uniref:Uncharacterized protein n=1 Tax=Botryobasidium botryosum (strain FD-172 SS1) TaxID=930990 RepID=A0A067M4Y4_BOTB1|nr:hypothetical protein BOTBODRAFT_39230 [Botryobasidium botryosum FD-172 SS1]